MKLQALEYFVTLAEAGSIRKAAQQLYVAQPSLTKSLKQMEEELGYPLMIRTVSGIRLTENGRKVYEDARQMLAMYRDWQALGRPGPLRQIHVYTYLSFPDFLLPDIVLRYRKEYPELDISFTVTEQPEHFLSRSAEQPVLALVMCRREEDMRRLSRAQGNAPYLLMKGAYRCLVNVNSPLAGRKSVSMRELRDYYLILPAMKRDDRLPDTADGYMHELLCQSEDQKRVEVETVSNVIPLVEKDSESYALSFWPAARRYRGVQEGRLVAVPIQEASAKGQFMLCCSRRACDQYPIVRQMVADIRTAAQDFLCRWGDPAQPG